MAGLTPSVASNLLRTEYDADFRTKANEEDMVTMDFSKPIGVEKIGNSLVVRILPTQDVNSLSSSAEGTTLTYDISTESNVTVSPVSRYSAFQVPRTLVVKMVNGEESQFKSKNRDQLLNGLKEGIGTYAASTAYPLSSGSLGPLHFDKANLLAAKRTLRTNAKSHFVNGTMIYAKYAPSEIDYLENIDVLMNAEARGDSENPYVSGFIVKALGMTFNETGCIVASGGIKYNCIHLKSAFIYAENQGPNVLDVQAFELVERFIAFAEFGVAAVFPEDAVQFQSPA